MQWSKRKQGDPRPLVRFERLNLIKAIENGHLVEKCPF